MARFCLFSDIHIHSWTAYAKLTEKGLNSRLIEIISCLDKIISEAHRLNCDALLFSGDLFHVQKVEAVVMDLTVRILRKSVIPIVMIPGNHDEASKMQNFHTLRSLHGSNNCIVLDKREGQTAKIAGTKISGVPFTSSPSRLLSACSSLSDSDILLCHTGFAGAMEGSDYIARQKDYVQPKQLMKFGFKLVVAGHFHQPQLFEQDCKKPYIVSAEKIFDGIENDILIPGAPLHHNFGDEGSKRGFWIYDTKKATLEFKHLNFPEFVRVKYSEEKSKSFPQKARGNYVACTVKNEVDLQAARAILESEAQGYDLTLKKKDKYEVERTTVRLGMSRKKILKRYVKETIPEGHSVTEILRTGMALLNSAETE